MFRPVSPTDPEDVRFPITRMINESGILVRRCGLGQEGQWVMSYVDPTAGFEGEFWTYRNEEMEKAAFKPAKDFWTVSLGAQFWHCTTEYVDTAGMHIAECLLTWPVFGAWNPFPANSVRILELRQHMSIRRIVTPPDVSRGD